MADVQQNSVADDAERGPGTILTMIRPGRFDRFRWAIPMTGTIGSPGTGPSPTPTFPVGTDVGFINLNFPTD